MASKKTQVGIKKDVKSKAGAKVEPIEDEEFTQKDLEEDLSQIHMRLSHFRKTISFFAFFCIGVFVLYFILIVSNGVAEEGPSYFTSKTVVILSIVLIGAIFGIYKTFKSIHKMMDEKVM